ncbi:MAG: signal peptidase II [Blastocatellia bacterium]|nr:signal peptidase II [Blastocatellia bacterium]MBL8196738.1 signal peptidase II [Blastocatellia bacterium]MBN8722261.1 signal peptidase II [Acidobacteriota bacterium]
MKQILKYLPLSLLVISLDQITKYWAYNNLRSKPDVHVIDNLFKLSYTENAGIAFGILSETNGNWKVWLLSAISFIAISLVIYFVSTSPSNKRLFLISLMLVLGGIVGNLLDRLHLQVVIDFIEVYLGDYHWPTFNIADVAICAGAFLLSVDILLETKETLPQSNEVKQ